MYEYRILACDVLKETTKGDLYTEQWCAQIQKQSTDTNIWAVLRPTYRITTGELELEPSDPIAGERGKNSRASVAPSSLDDCHHHHSSWWARSGESNHDTCTAVLRHFGKKSRGVTLSSIK